MNAKVVLLRSCCWLGAILDARAAYDLTVVRFHEIPAQIASEPALHPLAISALRTGGDAYALMWGWTALLVWASFKPLERRGALLLTTFPVIVLLMANKLVQTGRFTLSHIPSWFFILIFLAILFAFSYFYASPSAPQPVHD